MLIGSTAFAYSTNDIKLDGDVQLYYGTIDSNEAGTSDMFSKNATYADLSLSLGLTTDFNEYFSAGINASVDVENNIVGQSWSNTHRVPDSATSDNYTDDSSFWIGEAWLSVKAFDTTAILGRQTLDTPLAFTETWSIDENTFEAVLLTNNSISDTTIIASYISRSNGSNDDQSSLSLNDLGVSQGGVVSVDGKFETFANNGAYVAGVINNSYKPMTAQFWYYDFVDLANAYWVQTDFEFDNILLGAQYGNVDADGASDDDSAYALTLGYAMKDIATIKAAYSSVDDKGGLGYVGNVATANHQSKLYTSMWWSSGVVDLTGADSYSLTAEATVGPEIDIFVGYYFSDVNPKDSALDKYEFTELDIVASKSFGALDTSFALIFDDVNGDNIDDSRATHFQVYLTYNF
jgi:hypothetical protein